MSENKIKKIENLNQGAISKNLKHLNLSTVEKSIGDNQISIMEGLDCMENLISLNLSRVVFIKATTKSGKLITTLTSAAW
jgi:Holliday junction resolvasome RuvABC ATP-dependent DNA helicase subunit